MIKQSDKPPLLEDRVSNEQLLRFNFLSNKIGSPESSLTDEEWTEYFDLHKRYNIVKKEQRKVELDEKLLGYCRVHNSLEREQQGTLTDNTNYNTNSGNNNSNSTTKKRPNFKFHYFNLSDPPPKQKPLTVNSNPISLTNTDNTYRTPYIPNNSSGNNFGDNGGSERRIEWGGEID